MTRGTEQAIKELVHEIRTPLAALALLGEGLDEASRAAHRETVSLIEALLQNAAGLNRPGQPAPVESVVRSAVRMVAAVKPAAVVAISGTSSALVARETLEQILLNLLMNAARHSPPGAPVRVEITEVDGEVLIDVRDEGTGVSAEERERVFEDGFSTASSTGLGLGISRRLAESLGGRLVLADCSKGCRFTLAFPSH